MSKNNNFVKFFKNIYQSINRLLELYLNKLNLNNLLNILRSNKVLVTFVAIIILFLSYLSIPHVYNKFEVRKELENQLLNKFGLNFNFPTNFKYNFYPRPHFIIENSSILKKKFNISDVKKLSIFVSLNSLFSLKNITIKDVILENTNFNLNNKNSDFFLKLLDNDYLKSRFIIKDSNVFFRNNEEEILFVNKIIQMKYYYDIPELKNLATSENQLFNIPYYLTFNKDKKKIFSKINFKFLKLQIENEIDYYDKKKTGLINIIYAKNKSMATYELNKNIFVFNYFDKLNNPTFFYDGKINFNPFFFNINGKTNKLDLSSIFDPNLFVVQLIKTEIFNHESINFDLIIDANQIKQFQSFVDLNVNSKIQEGLIDFNKTKFSWKNYADFEVMDSLLYVNKNQLLLDGKLYVDIKDNNQIYKYLQISKNYRPNLEKLEFDFNYNFDQKVINFTSIKIDDEISDKVYGVLNKIILKKDELQNKIYFKNLMKKAIKAYVG